uniref:Uncharacterized protein n=1 Tax=Arundo donax TaxID=35708 RepID=A0A0A8ZK41_ARUDO
MKNAIIYKKIISNTIVFIDILVKVSPCRPCQCPKRLIFLDWRKY